MFPCNTKVSLLSCVFTTHSVFFLSFTRVVSPNRGYTVGTSNRAGRGLDSYFSTVITQEVFFVRIKLIFFLSGGLWSQFTKKKPN
jgi:hypothetical protein